MSPARPLRRVGHKGADLIAPGNTSASFDAALAAGVAMIEFDVIPEGADADGALFLAHDYVDFASRERVTLEEGLAHLAAETFADVELDVDLKGRGYELRVVRALREHGLIDRALVTTQYLESLDVIRAAEPAVRLGLSVPQLRSDPFDSPATLPFVLPRLAVYRALLPRRIGALMRARRFEALMAHWRLVTPRLVKAVRAAGGELFVWTVDEASRIRTFEAMGVTGIITNDPRLFVTAT
jgi:glycerophosphoryl diester phosphodiesterase